MRHGRKQNVPKNARPAPEGRNIRSASEIMLPIWNLYGGKVEGHMISQEIRHAKPSERKVKPKKHL